MKCIICGGNDQAIYNAREMMFGYREPFRYVECSACGCLRLTEIPADLGRYYPENYYSKNISPKSSFSNIITGSLRNRRNRYAVFKEGIVGRFFKKYPLALLALSKTSVTRDSRILDVGCGNGALLYSLMQIGFGKLTGIDPFLEQDIDYGESLKVFKKNLGELNGEWDIIMFNHSIEHMPDHEAILKDVGRLLAKGGICFISTPTTSSFAWRHYRQDWAQLDAPRHLFIHSVKSMGLLAEKAGFMVTDYYYNSGGFQFWGSEQYSKDIPLLSENSYYVNKRGKTFTRSEIAGFERRSRELNEKNDGDQAVFYISNSV